VQVCPGCGESSPDRFTECVFCGTPLAERREPTEERKVLTVVFCDLKDSTALGERLDPEALGEVLDLYFTAMTRVLRRHGGSIQKFIGDAIVAAFGLPVVHEDDALRAVRAASEMLDALARLNRQLTAAYGVALEVRIGVHTGDVVIRSGSNDQQLLTGDTLNTAARLEQAAGSGEILLGGPTYRLVRDAVEAQATERLDLKGKADAVEAHRLLRVFGDEQSSRRHDAPIIGREAEQALLEAAYAEAVRLARCTLLTVFGEAGVGKSRLVRALLDATAGEGMALRGRCLAYGEGTTFWPMVAIVRDACHIDPDDAPDVARAKLDRVARDPEVTRRVASALGWSDEQLPMAELYWGLRELLERLASVAPIVMVVDDVHWASASLLELLDHLVDTLEGPVLVLGTARPEMLEERPGWSDGPRRQRLVLDRLPDAMAEQVIDHLTRGLPFPSSVRSMIVRAAEGNPLFVEQLISMLVDSGTLVEAEGEWIVRGDLRELSIPPSIDALLVARLDLLGTEERAVVEPAAVIGLGFPSRAVRDLAPADVAARLPVHLATLGRRQLVRATPDDDHSLDDHRFHHILIRDAAYRRSLKRTRADLHERFADWLEAFAEEHAGSAQRAEIIGFHLEQAYLLRAELGSMDARQRELGSRAAETLAEAGHRAFVRGDLPAAVALLGRSVALLPRHDPVRLGLLPDLAEAIMETGDFEGAADVLADARAPDAAIANEADVVRANLTQLMIDTYAGQEAAWSSRVSGEIEHAFDVFARSGHHVGMATAWRLRYALEGSAMRFDTAVHAAERVIEFADRAGDVRQGRRGAVAYAQSALHGPTPVAEAIRRCEDLITGIEGDRRSQAVVQLCLAQLVAMQGDTARARDLYRSARAMLRELGPGVLASSTSTDAAAVELRAGDGETAERLLIQDDEELRAFGETYLRSVVLGVLSGVLLDRGDPAAAEAIALEARDIAARDDTAAQVLWRSALARCRSAQGSSAEGLTLADEAIALAEGTAAPIQLAQALVARAEVLDACGRDADGAADRQRALGLYEAKGDRVNAQRLTASLTTP
jgi:class 3 adenylate cyclase/tetratricopeptide (TPR) repeat protein